jgi:hypothetical protein
MKNSRPRFIKLRHAPQCTEVLQQRRDRSERIRPDGIELWIPGQTADRARDVVAKMLDVPVERVIVHQIRVGGGFGRRLMLDYVAEATLVAQRVKAPVKLMWTREDDMTHDYYRVGGFHSLRGAVDAQGRLSAWEEHFVTFTADRKNPVAGGGLNADEFPAPLLPNVHITQTMLPLGTRCGPWRAVLTHVHEFVPQQSEPCRPGAHAAAVSALIPASHRLDAWLGGAPDGEDSFPRTDGGHLPTSKMFRAAFTSRS